jgi:phosphatidate phosphatase APP1
MPVSAGNPTKQILHWAARVEDRLHKFRERRARRRGLIPTIIPYTGYGSTTWIRVLGRVLLTKQSSKTRSRQRGKKQKRDTSIRGWRSFTSVPINDGTVAIEIDGQHFTVSADRGGVVDSVVPVHLTPGWHTVKLRTEGSTPAEAPIFIVHPHTTFGVVSDVDDTVMVTALPRPLLAAWNTFVLDEHARIPTPGMAVLLERLANEHPGSPVIYLSTGAWNVAPTLTRFLSRNLYPPGTLLLTDWGPTHDRLFRNGRAHKEDNLRRLAREFPTIRWLLIGDDGQNDEEIYGKFVDEAPHNVAAVAIRQLSPSEAVLAGGRSKSGHERAALVPWVYAPDGASLSKNLSTIGVL